jgi:hypothetical protein
MLSQSGYLRIWCIFIFIFELNFFSYGKKEGLRYRYCVCVNSTYRFLYRVSDFHETYYERYAPGEVGILML